MAGEQGVILNLHAPNGLSKAKEQSAWLNSCASSRKVPPDCWRKTRIVRVPGWSSLNSIGSDAPPRCGERGDKFRSQADGKKPNTLRPTREGANGTPPALILMSQLGHSGPGQANSKSGHVPYAAESGSKFRALADSREPLRLDGAAGDAIQSPQLGPRIMRYELSDYEWTAIKPTLPNKPPGVRRANDRRVLNGIF